MFPPALGTTGAQNWPQPAATAPREPGRMPSPVPGTPTVKTLADMSPSRREVHRALWGKPRD